MNGIQKAAQAVMVIERGAITAVFEVANDEPGILSVATDIASDTRYSAVAHVLLICASQLVPDPLWTVKILSIAGAMMGMSIEDREAAKDRDIPF
jgi:hypothetical protein